LSILIRKELGLFIGFDENLKRLERLLSTIKATLEDAEEAQFTDNTIKIWLLKLKAAAHILDDILDECATEALAMNGVQRIQVWTITQGTKLILILVFHLSIICV
jgi:hypothetical protein